MSKPLDASAYTAIVDSHRMALPGAEATGTANPNQVLEVTIKIRRKKALPELDGRPTKLLTRDELAATFGASQDDADQVIATLTKFGLKNTGTDLATRTLTFTGTVAEMENAFLVKLFNYSHPDGGYRGRTGYVHIPKTLDSIVEGVFGLDNRRVARRKKHSPAHLTGKTKTAGIAESWYTPAELAEHYSFPAGDGSGQTVGLLEFGGGYFPADLQQFCKLANIDTPKVIPVSVDGTSTSDKDGAEGEVMLDIEVFAGVCPSADIVVYFANFSEKGWVAAIDKAIQDKQNNPGVISASWGYAGAATMGATCCTDVKSGGNKTATAGSYTAGSGFDAVSGWGTPIGTALAKAVARLPPVEK